LPERSGAPAHDRRIEIRRKPNPQHGKSHVVAVCPTWSTSVRKINGKRTAVPQPDSSSDSLCPGMASTDAKSSLSLTVPELRARFLDEQTHGLELLAPVLARKRGTSADELHLRVVGSALFAARVAAQTAGPDTPGATARARPAGVGSQPRLG
jgi:MftR C-terminal domain